MDNIFAVSLEKLVAALELEDINYMIVGGFAVSYYNRARTTNDIDLIVQIYPEQIGKILKHFPMWMGFEDSFKQNLKQGMLVNITNYETGIRYDFMAYKDSDYNYTAFERRQKVNFFGVDCYLASKEDLIIAKLRWYNMSNSEKQLEDLRFLLLDNKLNMEYLRWWTFKLKIKSHGLLG